MCQIYLVGGAVRDQLLGIPNYDRDWVVVGATPETMLMQGFEQVGKDFPVFLHPKTKEEYALARTERKQGQGYHGFQIFADPSVTLEEDLKRRDLTINAMAQQPDTGEIIDPYGGQRDLKARVLRHVSMAFVEDPLRVLRVARFAAKFAPLGFRLAAETQALMQQMVASGELKALTPERVWQECVKALKTDHPAVFFETLKKVGALEVLFPELACLFSVPQSPKHHPEGDTGTHTLMVLQASVQQSKDVDVRFACLVHDVGKCVTDAKLWPKHPEHERLGVPIVKQLCQRYRVPKTTAHLAQLVTRWHGAIHRGLDYAQAKQFETILQVLEQTRAFKKPETFQKLLTCCYADHLGRKGFEQQPYPQQAFWQQALEKTQQIDIQAILQQGFQGKAISEQLHQERLKRLTDWLKASS